MRPYVRIVLINYDGGEITMRCLTSLMKLTYPADRFEIVMVDNASIDGIVWSVKSRFPGVRIIESLTNEGFARGNNLAFTDLDGVDVVALINNDTIVDPDWLSELVSPLTNDDGVGITTSKMLFNRRVLGLSLQASEARIFVSGVRIEGRDAWKETTFDERWSACRIPEWSALRDAPSGCLSSTYGASLSIDVKTTEPPCTLSLRLSSETPTELRVLGPDVRVTVSTDSEPKWVDFPMPRFGHVVNSAGGGIFTGLHGGDIGFKELDVGQFNAPREVFSFCGGAAAIKKEVLDDIGMFDSSFFLYYEDLDLSWRAHYRGWRIKYVPTAVVFHEHAYSSGEWSPFFRFWVDRNRRLTLIKNAPAAAAAKALLGAIVWGLRDSLTPVARSCVRFRRPPWESSKYRLRQLASFLKAVPSAYAVRRRQLHNSKIRPEFVNGWISTRFVSEGAGERTSRGN